MLDAERLAYIQLAPTVTAYRLSLRQVSASKPSDNARTAIEDTNAIAYLGEPTPGTSADSAGITNSQDLLQVSPADTTIALTQSTNYYESYKTYGRTFARVVPSGAQEAQAQVMEMRSLGIRRLYVANDGSQYGTGIALAVRSAAASAGITTQESATGAQAAFYGGKSTSAAAAFFSANTGLKLFAPSALAGAAFPAGARSVYVSTPGFLGKDYPAAARASFLRPFESTYHRVPMPEAIFGYEAMAAVLAVIHENGSQANDRGRVVRDFFAIKSRPSVLGTYSITSSGDTTLGPFVFSRVAAGRLVPLRFLQVQG